MKKLLIVALSFFSISMHAMEDEQKEKPRIECCINFYHKIISETISDFSEGNILTLPSLKPITLSYGHFRSIGEIIQDDFIGNGYGLSNQEGRNIGNSYGFYISPDNQTSIDLTAILTSVYVAGINKTKKKIEKKCNKKFDEGLQCGKEYAKHYAEDAAEKAARTNALKMSYLRQISCTLLGAISASSIIGVLWYFYK